MAPAPLRFILAAEALCLASAALMWIRTWQGPTPCRIRAAALLTAGGFILKFVRVSLTLILGAGGR